MWFPSKTMSLPCHHYRAIVGHVPRLQGTWKMSGGLGQRCQTTSEVLQPCNRNNSRVYFKISQNHTTLCSILSLHKPMSLYGFSNVDQEGYRKTKRSITTYCVFIGANCLFWCSKKQPINACFKTEEDSCFLAFIIIELTWITYLWDIDVSLSKPPQLFCDNFSALYMFINLMFHAYSKYIKLDYHFF